MSTGCSWASVGRKLPKTPAHVLTVTGVRPPAAPGPPRPRRDTLFPQVKHAALSFIMRDYLD